MNESEASKWSLVRHAGVGDEGNAHLASFSGKTQISQAGGAQSGALSADEPELAEVIAAWPTLPPATRRKIVGLVRSLADR